MQSLSYVDEQIRDVIIEHTPHADLQHQCLLDLKTSLQYILKKPKPTLEHCIRIKCWKVKDIVTLSLLIECLRRTRTGRSQKTFHQLSWEENQKNENLVQI